MKETIKILTELAVVFVKIGMFTFGGGYAMLPLLQAELVEKRQWLTAERLMDYFCIGQSTPGIIAVNVATFVGYARGKTWGAIVATLALITAPIVIILSLANILVLYMENQYVVKAFEGIRIVVTALVAEAVFKLWKTAVHSCLDFAVFVAALVLSIGLKVSPMWIVLGFGCVGVWLGLRGKKQ